MLQQPILLVQALIVYNSCYRSLLDLWYFPDPREDLESRSPNLGLYTTKGTL